MRTCGDRKIPYNGRYRGQNSSLNTEMEVIAMALSNLSGWSKNNAEAACGAACGAADKPEEKPAACGAACGAGDK